MHDASQATFARLGDVGNRTQSTHVAYRRRAQNLRRQAERERPEDERKLQPSLTLAAVIAWFCTQHERWAPATIRLYRTALAADIQNRVKAGSPHMEQMEALREQAIFGSPRPKPRKGDRRTSARKRKSMRIDELVRLRGMLMAGDALDRVCGGYLWLNAHLGLRPIEWHGATLDGNELRIRCAKVTNGRGLAVTRTLDLTAVTATNPNFARHVGFLLQAFHRRAAEAGDAATLWQRLRSRIARACRRANIRRIAPYTTRHIALATAKQNLSTEEVAAIAGHKTTQTAVTRYARRSTGLALHLGQVRPDAELVRRVVRSPKALRTITIEPRVPTPQPRMAPW